MGMYESQVNRTKAGCRGNGVNAMPYKLAINREGWNLHAHSLPLLPRQPMRCITGDTGPA
jgi:hypothetical protein